MTNTAVALLLAYVAFLIGGTAYIVFGLGHSPWWFLLAIALLPITDTKK